MRPWTCLLALLALLGLQVPRSLANAAATIEGTVTDESGAVVAGATVTATNESTRWTRSATTDAHGSYVIVGWLPGPLAYRFERVAG